MTSNGGFQSPEFESRKLGDDLMRDLTEPGRVLHPLQQRVSRDDTLMLALRKNGLNIYYRGGNLLRLSALGDSRYSTFFDQNYCKPTGSILPPLPGAINSIAECGSWVSAFPVLKEIMNGFLAEHPKSEREFQQLVVWENNRSGVSNETEYFITDIEFADSAQNARFDMLGLKWPAHERKFGDRCRPVIFEMKYGDAAYEGDAGIIKHIQDFNAVLSKLEVQAAFSHTISDQFNQLSDLGQVRFNKSKAVEKITLEGKLEVVFLLANHNPRSSKLLRIIKEIEDPTHYDLRFFVSSFAGYGLHSECMLDLERFRKLLEQRLS